ncbi:uncharacterized protein LOC124410039 isoform X2 [Diprion similis]|uniref:uncharacterized protein LOC124410039 isoform X2 n=1 Tax=Diprion similis TaxID=362088 RepID=UPI001EF842B3|nr:uncharacterized protein LOC124410039 isoform X2 [Diprion similis]
MVTDNTNQADDTTALLRAARSGNLEKVVEYLDGDLDINTANSNGLNALHLASKDGHVEIVTELLKRGARVDAATKKGNTALHIASLAGQVEIVNILLQHGSTVNIQSQNGFTPLYMAAQENHDQVVKILLCNGANQSLATEDGFTPLAVAMQQGHDKVVSVLLENDSKGKVRLPALHIAAKKDDCKAADLLLQNDHKPDVTSKSGFTPLHIAAHYSNEEIAGLLIKRGADVNYLAKHNISPLHVAAKWGKINMVKLLLENAATIDAKTRDGLTPLHCAARSGHDQVVAVLLENSAPISARTKNGLAPLHMASQGDHVDAARVLLYHRAPVDEVTIDYLTSLHVAAHCGHVRVAKLLLDRRADPNARALNGFTPLHIACKKNRIKVVELLIKHGASIESTTESGLTPLHVASFMGCMNIVIFLLQHEANPDVPTVRGETPLHLAARANQTDIIRILLRNGAKVDARAREQQTPLHVASRLGNVDIVMLLLQHGAAVDTATKDMYTALHIAAKEGQEEVAAILVENNASIKATTKNGFTPLHIAAKYGNMSVAKILLQKGNVLDARGKNEITALHMACHYDHPGVAGLLLEKGASPCVTSQNGHTPLHVAARKNQMEIASALLERGADPNAESKAGFTPLHMSAQKGHHDITNLLIEHGADPNHKAKNGLTALHLCAQEDFVRVASTLSKNGASVESRTETGYRPIHVAAHFGNSSMVRFLLKQNAEVDVKTNQDYTPLHQAAQQGHAHVASALLDGNASHNARTKDGLTALNIAQKLGYISVMEVLKGLTYDNLAPCNKNWEDKYKVVAPESLQEASFMSDSDDEGGSDTLISEQPYRYLTADLMKSLRDDSLPIDVTRDDPIHRQVSKEDRQDFVQSNNYCSAENFEMQDSTTLGRMNPRSFLVSFLVDARGGTMRGCRHSGVRIVVPPRRATMPIRVTCRLVKVTKTTSPPPLMEGEALATRIVEMGPVGATFLGPVLIDVPHFASVRGKDREIIILRSENGETWKEHDNALDNDDTLAGTPHDPQMSGSYSGRITRIITTDFPQYFAIITRIKQEVHGIGSEGGILISSVVNHVQAVFPPGALTKKIKVGLQAHIIPYELTAKLLGNCVAVSPVITIEPRRRKFHKPITLTIPTPQAANKGMINQYGGGTPTLRLLCSIAGGTSDAQWEDVTGSTPLTFMNDRVSFTTTVSARFWLMDCRNIGEVPKMATELYRESLFVPFVTNFVIYSKRMDLLEATLRILCMTDGKEGLHTLERQEEFLEIVKSRDVEALDGKDFYIEFSGNLTPVTKSGVQLRFTFRAFRQNRLSFHAKVKDPLLDPVARMLFMREPKVAKGEPSQQPICILNIVLPELLGKKKVELRFDKESDIEDSNIICQKIDSYASEYEAEGKEKSDYPKAVVASPLHEVKSVRGKHDDDQRDAVNITEFFAQNAACPLETVDASYLNKVDAGKRSDDAPSDVEKQTYSEKLKFWEEIGKQRSISSMDLSDLEVPQNNVDLATEDISGQLTKSGSLLIQEKEELIEEIVEGDGMEGEERKNSIDIPDISECSVAEKAHYFEEQIQRELMTPAKTTLCSKAQVDLDAINKARAAKREKQQLDVKISHKGLIGVRQGDEEHASVVPSKTDNIIINVANNMCNAAKECSESAVVDLHGVQSLEPVNSKTTPFTSSNDEQMQRGKPIKTLREDVNSKLDYGADDGRVEQILASDDVVKELLSSSRCNNLVSLNDISHVSPRMANTSPTSVITICQEFLVGERQHASRQLWKDIDEAVGKADSVADQIQLKLVERSEADANHLNLEHRDVVERSLGDETIPEQYADKEASSTHIENIEHRTAEIALETGSDVSMQPSEEQDTKSIRINKECQPALPANDRDKGKQIERICVSILDVGADEASNQLKLTDEFQSEEANRSVITETSRQSEGLARQCETKACHEFSDSEITSEDVPAISGDQRNSVKINTTKKECDSRIPKHVGLTKMEHETQPVKRKDNAGSRIPVASDQQITSVLQPELKAGPRTSHRKVIAGIANGKESESRIPRRTAEASKTETDERFVHRYRTEYEAHTEAIESPKESFPAAALNMTDSSKIVTTKDTQASQVSHRVVESLRAEETMRLSVSKSTDEISLTDVTIESKKFKDHTFGADSTKASYLSENISDNVMAEFTSIKSTADHRTSATSREKGTISPEMSAITAMALITATQEELVEEKTNGRMKSTLAKKTPTQSVEEIYRNNEELEMTLKREMSVKLLDNGKSFIAEGSASTTISDSMQQEKVKLLEDEHGFLIDATNISSFGETTAHASVRICTDFSAVKVEQKSERTATTFDADNSFAQGALSSRTAVIDNVASRESEKIGIDVDDEVIVLAKSRDCETINEPTAEVETFHNDDGILTKESEVRRIAETIIRSIETEIESTSILAENIVFQSVGEVEDYSSQEQLTNAKLNHYKLGRESKQESISITEELTRDEESSPGSRNREGSLPSETSGGRWFHEQDMTISPSTASDHTEAEDSIEIDSNGLGNRRKLGLPECHLEEMQQQAVANILDQDGRAIAFSRKESFDDLATWDTATLRMSGARVLEIMEPTDVEVNVTGESILWKTNEAAHERCVASHSPTTVQDDSGASTLASTSRGKLCGERAGTIGSNTLFKQSNLTDDPIVDDYVRNNYGMGFDPKINDAEARSQTSILPKLRIQNLDIKPVNWMIGDEKIEISESLQPSEAFNQELEEYESVVKQFSLEGMKNENVILPIDQNQERPFACEDVNMNDGTPIKLGQKETPKTKFTVIPVSDKQLESELVENNLDISCQELMETLQKEFDAKTPTEHFAMETSKVESPTDKEVGYNPVKLVNDDYSTQKHTLKKSGKQTSPVTGTGANETGYFEMTKFQSPMQLAEERKEETVGMKGEIDGKYEYDTALGWCGTDNRTEKTLTGDASGSTEKSMESVECTVSSGNERIQHVLGLPQDDDVTTVGGGIFDSQPTLDHRTTADHDAGTITKTRRDLQVTNINLSARYAITVLDQVVKKEIAEVKESLEAAKQDLIDELSENSKMVFHIKDSPSEFQFKLESESIPNELPFLYKAPSANDQPNKHDGTENTGAASPVAKLRSTGADVKVDVDKKLELVSRELRKDSGAITKETDEGDFKSESKKEIEILKRETVIDAKVEKPPTTDLSGNGNCSVPIPIDTSVPATAADPGPVSVPVPVTAPVPASRSSSDVETIDNSFLMCPPQPAPRRRHKPERALKKIRSDSETDIGSSSGESNYHSCDYEIGSGSRPSSSDIEAMQSGILSGTASEYETALMSVENSSASKPTSQDYHTAISSLSSRESIKSLYSESSGHLASIESSSELSETLVPSESDLDRDDFDESVDHVLETDGVSVGATIVLKASHAPDNDNVLPAPSDAACNIVETNVSAVATSRMKRSSEMIFHQDDESCEKIGSVVMDTCEHQYSNSKNVLHNKSIDNATSTTLIVESEFVGDGDMQSVDITTSRVDEDGIQSVCTQVTSRDKGVSANNTSSRLAESESVIVENWMATNAGGSSSIVQSNTMDVRAEEGATVTDAEIEFTGFEQRPDLSLIQQASVSTSTASGISLETVIDNTEKQERRSPDSDSFELVDKPDIIDDFVVIEEVGREAEEFDAEGKSIHISSMSIVSANVKTYDREVENLITNTKREDHSQPTSQLQVRNNELFDFESEDSPPQVSNEEHLYSQSYSDDEQYEGGKKWVEMQFQTDARGYEIDYDRGPLEDIKEEEITDFEAGSSRFGSLGSHKESVGSIGSARGSLGSTPEYDVLAGRKYFTKPSEHDNLSLSSLQEFESLENAVAMENSKKFHCGSQDSINNGSLPRRYLAGRSGHGDDVSLSSLKDFEGLETACREAHMIELRAREEEDLLDHESPENRYKLEGLARAKAESSTPASFNPSTSGSDDYEKRIREIDEIIRIAQSNVEKFDRQDDTAEDISQIDITETDSRGPGVNIGPGQSKLIEAADNFCAIGLNEGQSRVVQVQPKDQDIMETSTDSLECDDNAVDKRCDPLCRSSDSLEMKTNLDLPSLSSDSLNNTRDPRELQPPSCTFDQFDNSCRRISSDSLEIPSSEHQEGNIVQDKSHEASCDNRNYSERSDTDNSSVRRVASTEAASLANTSLKCDLPNDGT